MRLIMLGYSLPPAQKRKIWHSARKKCNAPILELHQKGKPELLEQNVLFNEAQRADDFLDRANDPDVVLWDQCALACAAADVLE